MENWVYQIQRMLADKLDTYKGRGNSYMDDNIQEIQELYKEEELKKEGSRMMKLFSSNHMKWTAQHHYQQKAQAL